MTTDAEGEWAMKVCELVLLGHAAAASVWQRLKVAHVAYPVAIALLAAPAFSQGQQSKIIPRLCYLGFGPSVFEARWRRYDAFFEALQDLGYQDGRSIIIDYLSAEGRVERYEPPRDCRRPQLLRGRGHDEQDDEQVFA